MKDWYFFVREASAGNRRAARSVATRLGSRGVSLPSRGNDKLQVSHNFTVPIVNILCVIFLMRKRYRATTGVQDCDNSLSSVFSRHAIFDIKQFVQCLSVVEKRRQSIRCRTLRSFSSTSSHASCINLSFGIRSFRVPATTICNSVILQ